MTRFFARQAMVLIVGMSTCEGGTPVWVWDDNGNDASKEWSIANNWNLDILPGAGDFVYIGVDFFGANVANAANDTTLVDQNFTIDTLTVGNGADVDTNGNELIVNGLTTLGGAGTSIIIPENSGGSGVDSFDTNELIINSGGLVSMKGGRMEVDTNQVQIEAGGTISGNGFIDLQQAVAAGVQIFENSGTLTATDVLGSGTLSVTLQINQTDADGHIDLDGDSEVGVVNINRNDTLDINGTMTDSFSGTLNLFDGATFDIRDAWSLLGGTISVDTEGVSAGTAGAAAEITGAQFTMNTGTIALDTADIDTLLISSVFVANGGTIANSNEIIFDNTATINAGVDFQMAGNASSITVTDGNTVTINDANFDLGGNNAAGNITTIGLNATLDINLNDVAADDNFDHTINLNGGTLNVSNAADAVPWNLTGFAKVNAAGGATSTIAGDAVDISAIINVTGNSTLTISADSEFFGFAIVEVAAGSTFNVNGTPIYNGGSYTGAGIMRLGSSTIAAPTTWGVDTLDLDDGTHTVNANLTIEANAIDDVGNSFDGDITIADAALLTVTIGGGGSWTVGPLFGEINYNGNASVNTFLAGSNIILNGRLNVTGDGRTDAVLNIGNFGVVNINTAGQPLRLSGGNTTTNTNTITGSTINGPGILGADDGSALVGFGTIAADATVDFDGASNLQADNGTLNVNTIVDVGALGTADDDGVLNVIPAWNTNVAQLVELNGGTLQGGAITNDGAGGINGHGLVSAQVNNNSAISASGGGTLIVQTALNNNDWDGALNTGHLNAFSGSTLEIRDNAAFLFNGTVNVSPGTTVFANGFELEFEPASTLSMTGGTYRSTSAADIGGMVTVGAGTSTLQIEGTTVFEGTSRTMLTGNLQLDNVATQIDAGAMFSLGGSLINLAGRPLTLIDGADVDVLLQNDGTLVLGASAGQTQGLDFEQTASGVWNVELGGTGINDYDRMSLTGLAALDGTLNLSLIGGYVPSLIDPALTILTAGSVSGSFSAVAQPAGMPAGLMFNLVYNPTNVQLVVAELLLGDYNLDGIVDAADYVVWRKTLGTPVATPFSGADGDGDSTVDNDDYGVWTARFGQTAGSGSAVGQSPAVPEPGAALLALVAVCGGLMVRQRRLALGS